MKSEVLRQASALKDISDITSERVLLWVQNVEAQIEEREALDSQKEAKSIDCV